MATAERSSGRREENCGTGQFDGQIEPFLTFVEGEGEGWWPRVGLIRLSVTHPVGSICTSE